MYELEIRPSGGFALRLEGKLILLHTPEHPAVFLGRGNESISMFRGNFDIRDRLQERIALQPLGYADGVLRLGHPSLAGEYRLRFAELIVWKELTLSSIQMKLIWMMLVC